MERFVFSAPAGWRATAPGQHAVGEATLTVSEIGPLPEDVPSFMAAELGGPVEVKPVALASAWPAFAAETAAGDQRRLRMAIQLVEHGVIVKLDGPAAGFDAARAEVLDVLGQGTLAWGAPAFLTLAELLDGVRR